MKMINNQQLLRKLNDKYSKHDQAYILTMFESFIKKQQLFDHLKSMFYEDRREGHLFSAYQTIQIMKDFTPNHSFVKSLINDRIFKKYFTMYQNQDEKLFQYDVIESEKIMFHEPEQHFNYYMDHLKAEDRLIELTMIQYHQLKNAPSEAILKTFEKNFPIELSNEDLLELYDELASYNTYKPLQNRLLRKCIKAGHINQLSKIVLKHDLDFNPQEATQLISIITRQTDNTFTAHTKGSQRLLIKLIELNPQEADKLLYPFVSNLLGHYHINELHNWLEPFRDFNPDSQVLAKFDRIYTLYNDLDHIQTLGELYFEFKQWDQALDCFSMASELRPDDSKPLKWLSKTYLEKGLKAESEVYQKMYVDLQKQA